MKTEKPPILGLRTAIYAAPNLNAAKAFYSQLLGRDPYFDQPFYVGFNVGGYELGLDPNAAPMDGQNPGAVVYWGVENCEKSLEKLIALGAKTRENVRDVGESIKVATVFDPFGNVFGIIENPHFSLPDA